MKNEIMIPVRVYDVKIRDERTGEKMDDTIVLTKEQLRAGAMFDLGDEAIIWRIYNRHGYRVMEIGKARKVNLNLDLQELALKQEASACEPE